MKVQDPWLAFRHQIASASTAELQALLEVLPRDRRSPATYRLNRQRAKIINHELGRRGTRFQRRGAL